MDATTLGRKDRLILTAIDIINELGLQGLSIREISKRQGISNAALFNHFKTKNDLIMAVLDFFTQYDWIIYQSIKANGLKANDEIRFWIDAYFTYYENYPAITAIIQSYDMLRYEPELCEKVKIISINRDSYMKEMVEEAQSLGQLRSDVSSEDITDIIYGTLRNITMKWRISSFDFPLKTRAVNAINTILEAYAPK